MQLSMIGLGRMGASMARRLLAHGHQCVVHDANPSAADGLRAEGARAASTLAELVAALAPPRAIWLMVPAGVVDPVLGALSPLLEHGDVVIDGGNSHYHDDLRRAAQLRDAGLHHVDVGTSGGVAGQQRGYCLMIGGEREVVDRLVPVFASLAPGVEAAPRSAGREGPVASAEQGYLHCGDHGAGHFVKMVHNGIEYALMAAYAEGLDVLRHADVGLQARSVDAETTPLRHPEHYAYRLDLPAIAEVWRRGSVIGSWLLDLTASALARDPQLLAYDGRVSDSGEGRWTVEAAIDEAVPVPVLATALFDRFASRGEGEFAHRILSAMRHEFGGHVEKPR